MIEWAFFQAIQLVQAAADREVGDEVEHVIVLLGHLLVELEQLLSGSRQN